MALDPPTKISLAPLLGTGCYSMIVLSSCNLGRALKDLPGLMLPALFNCVAGAE